MIHKNNYKDFFDEYQKSVFQIENDLRFWKNFLSISIDKYKLENPVNKWISKSEFSLYNIKPNGVDTWLHTSDETFSIEINDLTTHSDNFFIWVMNLSIIRVYNSVELLLLQSIREKYFPLILNPIKGKKETNKVISEIKNYLSINSLNTDSTNNRHLIEFLKFQLPNFKNFLNVPVNIEWKNNWEQFYEIFSVLRNVITHHGMLVSPNIRNNLKSIAGDVFTHYFEQPLNAKDIEILKAKNEQYFLNFISQINDFASNTVKFIAGEQDFVFIGLRSV